MGGNLSGPPGDFATNFLKRLERGLQRGRNSRYQDLVTKLRDLYSPDPWKRYQEQRERLNTFFKARCDQYFHNFGVSFLARGSNMTGNHVQGHMLRLGLCMGLFRFMLVGHPEVIALLSRLASSGVAASEVSTADRDILDRAAVEAVQLVMKYHLAELEEFAKEQEANEQTSHFLAMFLAVFY